MEYIFDVNIYTDGDFHFPFVPCGMKDYADDNYTLVRSYKDRDEAIKDVVSICSFLKEHMHTNRDYVREDLNKCIDTFLDRLCSSSETENEYIAEYIYGNYDGTEFVFRVVPHCFHYDMRVTDEEYEMINKNENGVTMGMVKEAVLALFRQ